MSPEFAAFITGSLAAPFVMGVIAALFERVIRPSTLQSYVTPEHVEKVRKVVTARVKKFVLITFGALLLIILVLNSQLFVKVDVIAATPCYFIGALIGSWTINQEDRWARNRQTR